MRKILLQKNILRAGFVALMMAMSTTAQAQYQVQNGSFEEWDDLGNKKEEPAHWNSFTHATGSLAGMVGAQQVKKDEDVRPGTTGQASVKIYARSVFGVVAQGNITTGCINAGSMSATDANGNYNYTKTDDDNFNQKITGLPDAIHVWAKASCKYSGSINCNLHTEGYFQDPAGNEITATVIAKADKSDIQSSSDWQELTIPFAYNVTDGTRPAYALVTFTTSGTPGQGDKSDCMLVDDFEFLYYSELTAAKYDGQSITFADGAATIDAEFEAEKLTDLASNGQGAVIETAYDAETAELTITVKGDDFSVNADNQHVYTIQFNKAETPVSSTTFEDVLMVTINGEHAAPQLAAIVKSGLENEPQMLSLKNFILHSEDTDMYIGNINLPNVTINEDGSFTTKQTITIEEGDLEGVDFWMGPMLGEIPVEMTGSVIGDKFETVIYIDMMASLSQIIEVRFGNDLVYTPDVAVVYNENAVVFNANGYAVIEEEYDAEKLTQVMTLGWATAQTSFDDETAVLTIAVTVNSEEPFTREYSIQFNKPEVPQPEAKTYTDVLLVIVSGEPVEPQTADIVVTTAEDGTRTIALNNFVLGSGEAAMPVGNIVVPGIELDEDGNFQTSQVVTLTDGDDPSYDYWMAGMIGDVPIDAAGQMTDDKLEITIDINLSEDLVIKVVFGKDLVDGINNVRTIADSKLCFDLAGRRVNTPVKGAIYIVGGKKVVVK